MFIKVLNHVTLKSGSLLIDPVSGISMPINSRSLNLDSSKICESACLGNFSWTAYAYKGGRCSLWTGDLLGSRVTENSQKDLFVRSSEGLLAREFATYKEFLVKYSSFCFFAMHYWLSSCNQGTNRNQMIQRIQMF